MGPGATLSGDPAVGDGSDVLDGLEELGLGVLVGSMGAELVGFGISEEDDGADVFEEDEGGPEGIDTAPVTASFVSDRGSLMLETGPPGNVYGMLGSL